MNEFQTIIFNLLNTEFKNYKNLSKTDMIKIIDSTFKENPQIIRFPYVRKIQHILQGARKAHDTEEIIMILGEEL